MGKEARAREVERRRRQAEAAGNGAKPPPATPTKPERVKRELTEVEALAVQVIGLTHQLDQAAQEHAALLAQVVELKRQLLQAQCDARGAKRLELSKEHRLPKGGWVLTQDEHGVTTMEHDHEPAKLPAPKVLEPVEPAEDEGDAEPVEASTEPAVPTPQGA